MDIEEAAYGRPVREPAWNGRTRHARGGARAGGQSEVRTTTRLNEAQRLAIEADDNAPLLIVAGPGSGKTHVLVARIARMLREKLTAPSAILACAFTNRAANELRVRLEQAVGRAATAGMQVSTMHTACARMLRETGRRTGYIGEFDIADQKERSRRLRDALFKAGVDTSVLSPKDAGSRISFAKNVLADPADPQTCCHDGEPDQTHQQLAATAKAYARSLGEDGLLDFDDLLLRCLQMLDAGGEALRQARNRFTHVIVDEYQDTNEPQYRIVRHLCREHQRITVVGDLDQAIYGWRGADIGKILQFRKDYPSARIVNLEANYRSTPQICSAAAALMSTAAADERLEHQVVATDPTDGPAIRWAWFDYQSEEAEWVIARLIAHVGEPGDTTRAVLYRTNAQARPFETRLRRLEIPYRIIGGVGFFERAEILDLVAYLRVVDRPDDDEALRRIVNLPRRHLGRQTMRAIEELRDDERRRGARISTWGAIDLAIERQAVKRWQIRALGEFRSLIERLQMRRHEPVCDVIERVATETGYLRMVSDMDPDVAEDKQANIAELIDDASGWEDEDKELPANRLRGYIEHCEQMTEHEDEDDESATTFLMTLHGAKGQEFDLVALTGCEDGMLPHARAVAERTDGLAEERRLCYVGMTRAKRTLSLSGCEMRPALGGGHRSRSQSPFATELIDNGCIEPVTE